jgi:nitronate monooxygenase
MAAKWCAFRPARPRGTTGNIGAMALYAGEGVGTVSTVTPAADVIYQLANGAEALVRRWG